MSTQEGRAARRATSVPDTDLSARLLAYLRDGTASDPHGAGVLPAADPALAAPLHDPAIARRAPSR